MTQKSYHTGPSYYPKGEFGKWLANKLIEHGMTIASLSKLTGISARSIYGYIIEERFPPARTTIKICTAFFEQDWKKIYKMVIYDRYPELKKEASESCDH